MNVRVEQRRTVEKMADVQATTTPRPGTRWARCKKRTEETKKNPLDSVPLVPAGRRAPVAMTGLRPSAGRGTRFFAYQRRANVERSRTPPRTDVETTRAFSRSREYRRSVRKMARTRVSGTRSTRDYRRNSSLSRPFRTISDKLHGQ